MIILKEQDAVIYGNAISTNDYLTFYFNQLDKICEEFNVSAEQKQQVVETYQQTYQQNLNKDDLNEFITNFVSSNHKKAVALATKNEHLIKIFLKDEKLKDILDQRTDILPKVIELMNEESLEKSPESENGEKNTISKLKIEIDVEL